MQNLPCHTHSTIGGGVSYLTIDIFPNSEFILQDEECLLIIGAQGLTVMNSSGTCQQQIDVNDVPEATGYPANEGVFALHKESHDAYYRYFIVWP